jgi:hypothetical protein
MALWPPSPLFEGAVRHPSNLPPPYTPTPATSAALWRHDLRRKLPLRVSMPRPCTPPLSHSAYADIHCTLYTGWHTLAMQLWDTIEVTTPTPTLDVCMYHQGTPSCMLKNPL